MYAPKDCVDCGAPFQPSNGRSLRCEPCRHKDKLARQKRYRQRHPERLAAMERRRNYGITDEEYDTFVEVQDGRCAICGAETTLHVDHDHQTGRVRGLLCGNCNRGVGCLQDSEFVLESAITYLRASRAVYH